MEQGIKYFIYARKSSENEERQILSIESQIKQLLKVSQKRKLKIVQVLREEKSAKAPGREVFTEMVNKIKAGEANGILCWKLNRLARNPVDGGTIQWLMQSHELEHIVSIEKDYRPEDNILMMNVEFGMANQFILDLRRDTMRGMLDKVKQGWFPFVAPVGYLNDPHTPQGQRKIFKDPERFDILRSLWDMLLTGAYTVPQIAKKAGESKLTAKGHNNIISLSALYHIFTNKFYAGEFDFKGQTYRGSHPPMITFDEFDHVQKIIGKRGKPRQRTHHFSFTGMVVCGDCGGMITADEKTKYQQNGNVHHYVYYRCSRRTKRPCKQEPIKIEDLEKQISDVLGNMVISNRFQNWALKKLRKVNKEETDEQSKVQQTIIKAYGQNKQMINTLLDLRLKGAIDDEIFSEKKASLFVEQKEIKKKIGRLNERVKDWFELAEKGFVFSKYAQHHFNSGDLETKKIILQTIGSNLVLKDKILSIEKKKLFDLIKEPAEFTKWYPRQESNLRPTA